MARLDSEKLDYKELNKFLTKEGFSDKEFADLLGVTTQAVALWRTGQREFSVTNSRLIRLFMKFPTLIREFGRV